MILTNPFSNRLQKWVQNGCSMYLASEHQGIVQFIRMKTLWQNVLKYAKSYIVKYEIC